MDPPVPGVPVIRLLKMYLCCAVNLRRYKSSILFVLLSNIPFSVMNIPFLPSGHKFSFLLGKYLRGNGWVGMVYV